MILPARPESPLFAEGWSATDPAPGGKPCLVSTGPTARIYLPFQPAVSGKIPVTLKLRIPGLGKNGIPIDELRISFSFNGNEMFTRRPGPGWFELKPAVPASRFHQGENLIEIALRAPVSLVDVAPTLAGLAGLPDAPGWSDGRGLLDPPDNERTLYATTTAHAPRRFAVIRPPWKYVHFDKTSLSDGPPETAQGRWLVDQAPPEEMLFDLGADPGERRDLAAQHPEVTAELRGLMEAWLARVGADGTAPPAGGEDLEKLKALGYVQ